MKKIFGLLTFIFILANTYSQKTLIGTVEYGYNIRGENAAAVAGMMPEKIIIKYGETGVTVEMVGGVMSTMMGKIVINSETGDMFMVKDSEKAIYIMSQDAIKSGAEKIDKPKLIEQEETKKIIGYNCTKHKLETNIDGKTQSQTLWITNKLKAPHYNSEIFDAMGAQNTFYYDIEGFPMLIETEMPGMPITLELEVENIKLKNIDRSEFEKPTGYTEKPFSQISTF